MGAFTDTIKNAFKNFGLSDALFILAAASVIYYTIMLLLRNNAKKLAFISVGVLIVTGIFAAFGAQSLKPHYLIFSAVLFAFILSVFSAELKRDIWDVQKRRHQGVTLVGTDAEEAEKCISEIIKALQNMSKNDIGAIIILSRTNIPPHIIESGVVIDSDISSQIIESVFFPKSPLHDGAMLISGKKVLAAGCFLPLSQEVNLPKELGTRHRAGIGITETLNVTALIVSEETGIISIAQSGKLTRYADAEMLKNTLKSYYWQYFTPGDKKRR